MTSNIPTASCFCVIDFSAQHIYFQKKVFFICQFFIGFSHNKVLLYIHLSQGFPGGSEVKASACNAEDLGLILGLGRSPGEGNGNPLQYSCLENPMEGRAWQATVHGVAKSRTRLNYFTFTFTLANASCSTFFIFIFSEGVLLFPKIHTKLLSAGSEVSHKTETIIFEVTWQLIPNYIDRSYQVNYST